MTAATSTCTPISRNAIQVPTELNSQAEKCSVAENQTRAGER